MRITNNTTYMKCRKELYEIESGDVEADIKYVNALYDAIFNYEEELEDAKVRQKRIAKYTDDE